MNQRGLTLLELLIALMIMATLTVLSTQSIQQALFSKSKIQTQLDEMSLVRDALKIIERDINLAFHYRDLETEFREAVKKAVRPSASPTPTPAEGFAPVPTPTVVATPHPGLESPEEEAARKANRADPVTHFEGTAEKIDFVTMNSGRLTENLAQADFVEVGYAVKPCTRLGGKQESVNCLVRRVDTMVEGDVTKGGEETVLLENVSEFKLRYFGQGKQDWVDSWNSRTGDSVARGSFPSAVEVSLTVENGETDKKRKISMQIVAQVRFPNNKERGRSTGGSSATAPGIPAAGP